MTLQNCIGCGKQLSKRQITKKTKYCSKECYHKHKTFSLEWRENRSIHASLSNKKRKKSGIYKCEKCDKIFETNTSLIAHKSYCNVILNSENCICDICKRVFLHDRGLKIHKSLVHCDIEKIYNRKKRISKKAINRQFSNISKKEIEFGILLLSCFDEVIHCFQIKSGTHKYDFFIPSFNLIIEFDGDYWHGNKKTQTLSQRMKKQRRIDEFNSEFAIINNYDIIRVWESDATTFIKILLEKKDAGNSVLQNWFNQKKCSSKNIRYFN